MLQVTKPGLTAVLALTASALVLAGARPALTADVPSPKASVMIVGLAHFVAHNDLHNSQFGDVQNPAFQSQIKLVLSDLAAFHPTKVFIEGPYGDASIKDKYKRYLQGTYELGSNEIYQLGFRLAAISRNSDIYPIDTINNATAFPFDYDKVTTSASAHGQSPILAEERAHTAAFLARQDELEARGDLLSLLRFLNSSDALNDSASAYMYLAQVGGGSDYAGADLVSYWYARNLHVYANIRRSINSENDRVIVLIGQGHAYQLRNYVELSPDLQLVDPEDYLK